MKKLLLIIPAFFLIMFACSDDPCADIDCNSNGVCVEGTCECDEGFQGVNCETETRSGFLGTWSGVLDCPDLEDLLPDVVGQEIAITISEDPADIMRLQLSAPDLPLELFGGATIQDESTFSLDEDSREVTIPGSPFPVTITTTGVGELSGSSLDITINLATVIGTFACTANLTQ